MTVVLNGVVVNGVKLNKEPGDQYWPYVRLLITGNGTNAANNNTFSDRGPNNLAITRTGNVSLGTFTPFGTRWSHYFDGSSYISTPANTAFAFGTGDFTIECWVYPNALPSVVYLIGQTSSTDYAPVLASFSSGRPGLAVSSNGTTWAVNGTTTGAISLNTWTHLAWVRSGNKWSIYINGVENVIAASTAVTPYTSTDPLGIGSEAVAPINYPYTGYISNVRILKGTALYTQNFTPPAEPLTAITNTSLLTCNSNRSIDTSTNNFTITRVGTPNTVSFSPFNLENEITSTISNRGSAYFDGNGDRLDVATSANVNVGTGQFTLECWIWVESGGAVYRAIYIFGPTNYAGLYYYNGNLELWSISVIISMSGVPVKQWTHVAVTRDASNVVKLFINGKASTGVTSTVNYNYTTPRIGCNLLGTEPFLGYISNLRLLKGQALYTADFTVPTSPVTAITNTQLLLNFESSNIIDNSGINNIETAGNAQISTAQSKFGNSSIIFDGSGDWLATASKDLITVGNSDFTIEFWLRLGAAGTYNIYDQRSTGTQVTPVLYTNLGQIRYYVNAVDRITGSTLSANTWYHIALSRQSGNTRLFVDGVQVGSTYVDSNNYVAAPIYIGKSLADTSNIYNLNGYIDDLRVTVGIGRYFQNFTAPTTAHLLV